MPTEVQCDGTNSGFIYSHDTDSWADAKAGSTLSAQTNIPSGAGTHAVGADTNNFPAGEWRHFQGFWRFDLSAVGDLSSPKLYLPFNGATVGTEFIVRIRSFHPLTTADWTTSEADTLLGDLTISNTTEETFDLVPGVLTPNAVNEVIVRTKKWEDDVEEHDTFLVLMLGGSAMPTLIFGESTPSRSGWGIRQ